MEFLKKVFRNRRKIFSLLGSFLLALSLPISAYFVSSNQDFDRRSEAAIFDALVSEMEIKIQENPNHEPGAIILEFPDNLSSEEIEEITGRPRSTPEVLKDTPAERFEHIYVEPENVAREMAKYERYVPTKNVSLNYMAETFWEVDGSDRVLPRDWNSSNHWYFDNINLPEAWKLQGCGGGSGGCGGDDGVVVAVIDTGLAFNASEVEGQMNVHRPSDYASSGFSGRDDQGHGTYVAGVIASATNNNSNSPVGMAHNVRILSLKANTPYTPGFSFKKISDAMFYAVKSGADVINLSLGTNGSHGNVLSSAINFAVSNGVVVVAASGNGGMGKLSYPASDSKVIAVGSVNANNSRSRYSQYGSGLDFVAPVGQGSSAGNATWHQTLSCMPNCRSGSNLNNFSNRYLVGTSFAAPQVAGAVAIILGLEPSLSPAQVKKVLADTVDDLGSRSQFGHGLLNLENIYRHFGEGPDPGPPPDNLPLCGSCHEMVFPYEQDDHGDCTICAVGDVDRSISYPSPGERVEWKCVNSHGEVDCWARREGLDEPDDPQPPSPPSDCSSDSDCRGEAPYEICLASRGFCLRGDVNNDGSINMKDFEEFNKDFVSFRKNGWSTNLRRSDFNQDNRISMADYSIFVLSFRLATGLD